MGRLLGLPLLDVNMSAAVVGMIRTVVHGICSHRAHYIFPFGNHPHKVIKVLLFSGNIGEISNTVIADIHIIRFGFVLNPREFPFRVQPRVFNFKTSRNNIGNSYVIYFTVIQ